MIVINVHGEKVKIKTLLIQNFALDSFPASSV